MADRLSPISGRFTSPRRRSRALWAGLAALALVAAGCGGGGGDGEVTITYRQIAFFPSYEATPGSPSTPGGNGAYILYRITSVENQADTTFTINPNRFISEHDQETKEHAAHEAPLLGDQLLEATGVEPGDTARDLGCIVMVVRVDNAEETFGNFGGTVTSVDLSYEETASATVETTREEGNTGFRILDPANPETIQQECREGES
ncbi:MAG TPA: hypothetical protein VHI31_06380 [Actinomycetota bacterium]|nr:hypothetical protein [Actinomycetota bacterium]